MKKRTIRGRFFAALTLYTLVNFLLVGAALISFDLYECFRTGAVLTEELEEILVVGVVMLLLFPVSLGAAWQVSRWLLRPWRSMTEQAEHISKGRLEERIVVGHPDDEIGRLASTLNRTFDEYQTLVDRMQRFSYDASHQLRNPLAAIRTRSEVCLRHPRSAEEYRATIEEIQAGTVRLSRTVGQLLLLARAAGGALDEGRETVRLIELVSGVVDEAVLIGELQNISIVYREPAGDLSIRGIADLIREALSNLLDNALKFTPAGGRIEVALTALPDDRVRITVDDSGPGLEPARRSVVFRPFRRGGGGAREGSGLGLAIVADVCLAHGGSCGVEESPLGGCRFRMELPAGG